MQRIALAAALLAPVFSHADLLNITLPGTTAQGTWVFNDTYYTGYAYGAAWPSAMAPITSAPYSSDINASLNRLSGDGYITAGTDGMLYTAGFYPGAPGTVLEISATPSLDLNNLIFEMDFSETSPVTVSLTYNGGTILAPTYTYSGPGSSSSEMGGDSDMLALQWDLTGITVTDYTITIDAPIHTGIYAISVVEGDTFDGKAIPEPSTYAALAGLGVLGLALLRRKLSQK
ncbi:PEP-CTERM sorting domain-containing protein [Ruficoccus amylovorans]|uniref:PEP-CTERM sorting domain-containing protein n=2 Tax=Ruficoccus amylovorans TaxID=1804625 RepID=A0A842HGE0_9BACT|nr:PEP-CTERM sorting domain-containing protein [Ruficoccus amylovorans]